MELFRSILIDSILFKFCSKLILQCMESKKKNDKFLWTIIERISNNNGEIDGKKSSSIDLYTQLLI